MRPSPDGESPPFAKPRSRKSSVADHLAAQSTPSNHVPTTFFLRSEEELEGSADNTQGANPVEEKDDGIFGVQSLADTLEAAFGDQGRAVDSRSETAATQSGNDRDSLMGTTQASPNTFVKYHGNTRSSPATKHKRKLSSRTISNPLTPLNTEARSPVPPSALPSTPKSVSLQSLKLSDDDSSQDDNSQAVASSEEEDEGATTEQGESGSFPQLVMPSIQMPTRRPFTIKGKAMGRLKVLVAGENEVGKSSLIRSIVQQCEDIVHVDPSSPQSSFENVPNAKSATRRPKGSTSGTRRITEMHASTKPYPHWWSDVEDSRTSRRRKSTSDSVLERNICFIDTPGLKSAAPNADSSNFVVEYVESLLYQNLSVASMEDHDLAAIIGGNGGVQVDLVIYLLKPGHDISDDLEYMQQLSALTNLIPVIAKADTIPAPELVSIKTSILARLQSTSIRPFLFGKSLEDALLDVQGLSVAASLPESPEHLNASCEAEQYPSNLPTFPYAISSTPGPDADNMDASLLMSPDYVQPLLPSELSTLVGQVFNPESISWLRHSAAKKFMTWRRRARLPSPSLPLCGVQPQLQRHSIPSSPVGLHAGDLNTSYTPSVFSAASPSGVLVPRSGSPFYLSNLNSTLQSPFPGSSPSLSHTHLDGDGPADFSLTRYNNAPLGEHRLAEVRIAKWATDLQQSLRNERDRYEEIHRSERAKWLLERVGEEVKNGNIVTGPNGSPRAEWAVVRQNKGKDYPGRGRYGRVGQLDSRDPLGLCDFSDEFRRRGFVLMKVLGGISVFGAVMVATIKACGLEASLPEGGLWSWLTGGGE